MKLAALPFFLAIFAASAQAAPPSRDFSLVWADEFGFLDKTKWSTAFAAKIGDGSLKNVHRTRGMAFYKDENVEIVRDNRGDSFARLWTRREETVVPWEGGKKYAFSAGVLNSGGLFEPSFGYIEARIRTFGPSANGFISDFWLMHPDPTIWPPEIDILETSGTGNGQKAHVYLHWKDATSPEGRRNVGRTANVKTNEWNTYGILWEAAKIQWFVNNEKVGEPFETGVPQEKMLMLLSSEVGKNSYWGDPNRGAWPQKMDVDWVRVWRRK